MMSRVTKAHLDQLEPQDQKVEKAHLEKLVP